MTITGFGLSGVLMLCTVFAALYLFSVPRSPAEEEIVGLIRHYLRYQASQWYAELYQRGTVDARASQRYQEELDRIDKLAFESVKMGRLFPNYLFGRRPTFYAKVVIRDDSGQRQTRYFNLGRGNLVMAESSDFVWMFVF